MVSAGWFALGSDFSGDWARAAMARLTASAHIHRQRIGKLLKSWVSGPICKNEWQDDSCLPCIVRLISHHFFSVWRDLNTELDRSRIQLGVLVRFLANFPI